jgi:hypothetical protein
MQAFKEITVWKGCKTQPNHTYLLDGDKCYAYIKKGTTEPKYFIAPLRFNRSGRKFIELKKNPFTAPAASVPSSVIRVPGSKGAMYEVDPVAGTCSCLGFTYRGKCKHLEAATK